MPPSLPLPVPLPLPSSLRLGALHATRPLLQAATLLATLAALASPVAALDRGTSPTGVRYASGGVSQEELDTLKAEKAEKGRYTLWLTTAAKQSGAFLADVRVVVRDAKGQAVFDRKLEGPWLLADLPAGRYTIEAQLGDERQKAVASVSAGVVRQVVLYFATGDTLSPDRDTAAPPPAR